MCLIDFEQLVDHANSKRPLINQDLPIPQANGKTLINNSLHSLSKLENIASKKRKYHHKESSDFCSFSNPVLYVGHLSKSSIIVVDKPWKEVVRGLETAPVHRHIYGS